MATGDILSAVVRADGWSMDVTIEGFAVGATYDFGSLGSTPATVAAPKFSVAVVSEGYNAAGVLGTIARTVYGTHVVRKPYSAGGDHLTKQETVSGSDIVVRVALSESIYNDDKNGGAGTSGTNPAVTISAGWATNSGGGAQTSAAATALACTNNSTLDYPKCIAQWAWGHTPAWRQVTADTSIGCIAYHGHGIACVALSATDAHSNVVSGTATSKTDHAMSASGLHYESYDLAVPITGFTAGDDLTLRFIAYPLVGDENSYVDTSTNTTSTNDVLGWTQIKCRLPTTTTSIYVAATDHPTTPGNDSTGNGSTGTPYATIGKALSVVTDAAGKVSIIYVKAGGTTPGILGSTPASVAATGCFIEIMPNTGDTVTLNRGATYIAYKGTKVRYSGFTITGNNWLDGSATASAKLWFENCTFNPVTPNGTVGISYRSEGCFLVNCSWSTRDEFGAFAVANAYSFTGCSFAAGGTLHATAGFVASKLLGAAADVAYIRNKQNTTSPTNQNILWCNSEIKKLVTSASGGVAVSAEITGCAIVGNIIEAVSGSAYMLWVGGDSSMDAITNVLVAHNTVAGERCNLFYNDVGTSANVRTNCFVRNNAFRSYNIKSDLFGTPNANRIGNWAQTNGVNYSDNRYDGTVSPAYTGDYDGINVSYVNAKDTTYGQLGYTDDNSADGDGTGNGDYMPTEASVLYDHTLRQAYQSYDLYGVEL